MKHALRIYSDILILRDSTYRALKRSPGATAYIALMFLGVTLLAGCGKWLNLPYELSRPTGEDVLQQASGLIDQVEQDVVPEVQASLASLSTANLRAELEDVLPASVLPTPATLADVVNRVGLRTSQLVALIETEVDVPDEITDEIIAQPPNASTIGTLLDATGLSPERLRGILATAQLEELPDQVATGDGLGGLLSSAVLSGLTQNASVQDLVSQALLASGQIGEIAANLGLDAGTVNRLSERVGAVPDQLRDVVTIAEEELELVRPPLGVTASRLINFLGGWLSTPFQIAIAYMPLVLVALLAAKILGGKGTVTQHVFAMALAAAPAFLLFFTFADSSGQATPTTIDLAFRVVGRLLGLIAFAWALVILLKSLSVAHEFSGWRAAGTLALAVVILYVIVPVTTFLAAGYLLRG